jgi:hypothetical protein
LRIGIHEQRLEAAAREGHGQIDRRGSLPDAALLADD